MSNKPNPRRDDKGVPWCGGIKESCWRGCQWVNFKICLPQVQLDEAELARLQGIVEKLPKTADGVPVTQYTTLYYPAGEEIWECPVMGMVAKTPHGGDITISMCYSTLQAAESAKPPAPTKGAPR